METPRADPPASRFAPFTRWVLRHRWPVLTAIALVTALLASGIPDLEMDNANENWLVEGDRSLERSRKFTELFGSDDFVYVLHDAGDLFRPEALRRLGALADELADSVPHVMDATWIGNAELIEGRYEPALEATLASVGRPLTFTTITLGLGFSVLGASDMVGLGIFGGLASFAFVWALAADFLFAPALVLLLRPLGPERA